MNGKPKPADFKKNPTEVQGFVKSTDRLEEYV